MQEHHHAKENVIKAKAPLSTSQQSGWTEEDILLASGALSDSEIAFKGLDMDMGMGVSLSTSGVAVQSTFTVDYYDGSEFLQGRAEYVLMYRFWYELSVSPWSMK